MRVQPLFIIFLLLFLVVQPVWAAPSSLDVLEDSLRVALSGNQEKKVAFQVKNTGDEIITLEFDTANLDLTDSKGDKITLSFNPLAPVITPTTTSTIEMTVKADPRISFEQFGGTLIVKDQNSAANDALTLTIEIEPDICDFGQVGTDLKIDIEDPDSSDEFKPGDVIPIKVEVDNDGKNDIRVQVEAFLFNENRNIADTSSETKRIEDDESETYTLRLKIPVDQDDIDEDDEVTLFVKAFDDEFEELNCVQAKQSVDIKLEKDDIVIDEKETRIFPETAACDDTVTAYVKIVNIGSDDNDDVVVRVESPALRIQEKTESFSLERFNTDEDNTAVRQFQLRIPGDAQPRNYELTVRTNFKGGSDSTTLPLSVISCDATPSIKRGEAFPITIGILEEGTEAKQGATITLPVSITNNLIKKATYTVSIANIEDFADASTKRVTLNPGMRTTTFLELIVKEKALLGTYSGAIIVKEGATILASENVIFKVRETEEAKQAEAFSPLVSSIPISVWLIINVSILAAILLSVKVVISAVRK